MLVEKYTVFKSNISFETSGQAIEFVCARIYSLKGWGSLLVSSIVLRLFNVSIPIHRNPLLRLPQRFSFLVMFRRLEVKSILLSTLSLPWCLRFPKASIICMLVFFHLGHLEEQGLCPRQTRPKPRRIVHSMISLLYVC